MKMVGTPTPTAAAVGAVPLASHAAHSLVGRSANSIGDAADLVIATDEGPFNVAGVLTSQKVKAGNIDALAVTFAALAQVVKNGVDPAGKQTFSGAAALGATTTYVQVTANGALSLPDPTLHAGRRVPIQKTTDSALATFTLVRFGSEKIDNVAATYIVSFFNTATHPEFVLKCDGADWWV